MTTSSELKSVYTGCIYRSDLDVTKIMCTSPRVIPTIECGKSSHTLDYTCPVCLTHNDSNISYIYEMFEGFETFVSDAGYTPFQVYICDWCGSRWFRAYTARQQYTCYDAYYWINPCYHNVDDII